MVENRRSWEFRLQAGSENRVNAELQTQYCAKFPVTHSFLNLLPDMSFGSLWIDCFSVLRQVGWATGEKRGPQSPVRKPEGIVSRGPHSPRDCPILDTRRRKFFNPGAEPFHPGAIIEAARTGRAHGQTLRI